MAQVLAEVETTMAARENDVRQREEAVSKREQEVKRREQAVLVASAKFLMMDKNVKAWAAAGAPKLAG